MEKEQLEKMRHSLAHLMSMAIMEKKYPQAGLGVGPSIENGFYQDYDLPESISEKDFEWIEKRMREMISQKIKFVKSEASFEDALKFYTHDPYKTEMIHGLKEKGEKVLSFYDSDWFHNLCAGPHVEDTSEINPDAFKLTHVAGAYWRGDSKNKMLQRIYGVAFATKAELDEYLHLLEEAEKRDHRKIGAEQDLFFFDEKVGKGLVMWLPNGTIIRNEIEKLATDFERAAGYVRVRTPHLGKEELYLTSGHLPYYKDSMYPAMVMDDGTYYLKAMNCPHHHTIFNHNKHSYRDMPLRIAEYGECYRNELSGTLAGLLRVRCMAMNDAHIYCRKDQVKAEFKSVIDLMVKYFKIFGLENYWFRLSKWSPDHLDKYINEPQNWEYSEGIIREVLQEMKVPFVEAEDEAAFYGPKIDVMFKSIIGREETMSTVQLDFAAKQKFGLSYTDETGQDNNEVFVIHRAPLSTHERFTAFLIEHYGGRWPVWLCPTQIVLVPVVDKHIEGAKAIELELFNLGVRVESDCASETLGNRVRKAANRQVPYIIVVGDKELAGEDWMIKVRGQKEQIKMSKTEFLVKIQSEIKDRI
ncbi:MAG: threonine--tRNA ligase [Candidatus Magasanikbacteria bacterium]